MIIVSNQDSFVPTSAKLLDFAGEIVLVMLAFLLHFHIPGSFGHFGVISDSVVGNLYAKLA
jgi:hypothetical protein